MCCFLMKILIIISRKGQYMTKTYVKTSESVARSHPDKVADQIGDSIFDYLRTLKKDAQSAVEVAAAADTLLIFGEIDKDIVQAKNGITSVEYANPELANKIKEIAIDRIRKIGYIEKDYNPMILVKLVTQSSEINNAVEESESHESAAGDQGIVTGFAVAETKQFHALHYILANRIIKELESDRDTGKIKWLNPDAKSQVTVKYEYSEKGLDIPVAIENILVSQCHSENVTLDEVRKSLTNRVKEITIDFLNDNKKFLNVEKLVQSLTKTEYLINPAGDWHKGGPQSDSGLSSRKLVVDNYGSSAPIGGGGTSGKNFNKVDRSGAYYARHIAKSIVVSGLADKCLVELGFAIGVPEAVSVNIETFGTENTSLKIIDRIVRNNFDFKVKNMIELCDKIPEIVKTSEYGNYTDDDFPWEQTISL